MNTLATDTEVQRQALALQTYLNVSSAIHLYANPGPYTPAVTLADVADVSGDGYTPVPVTGLWSNPGRIYPGYWTIDGPVVGWDSPAVGSYVAYGATITAGLYLAYLGSFNAPIVRSPGGGRFQVKFSLVVASASLLLVRLYYGHSHLASLAGQSAVSSFSP